jgi:tetratricopeptide (TPR) repeat protein
MGQIFFRLGSLAKSYRFIEDLNSPNAENIKGNLYILRNKYELAYAQFKLALEKKQNSQNAMERILPLAWLLGDWEEGAKIAERVIASPQTQINKMTLVSAFYTQKGDYVKAKEVLSTIVSRSRRGTEIDVTQLHSFVGLMQNQPYVVKKQAALSCAQFDMVNCWLSFQMDQWDSFPLTIRRPEPMLVKKDWEKLTQEDLNQPLVETVYVNQLDIEELDDKLIQLIPNAR